MSKGKEKDTALCRNCQVKLMPHLPETEGREAFYECEKCGLLMLHDGYVIYDPRDTKWKQKATGGIT